MYVHAHVMNQVAKTPTPAASEVSIPSHLGFVVSPHSRSTSGRRNDASASSTPPPPGSSDNHGSAHESNEDDDGHGPQDVAAPPPATIATMQEPPNPSTGQVQDKVAAEYTIVPPTQPGGALQLMVQDEAIRTTVRHAIADLDRYLAFENGFPDAITRARVIADLLAAAAQSLSFDGLYDRLKTDHDFTRTLSALVSPSKPISHKHLQLMVARQPKQRMSTFRGNIKKLADAQVVAFYGLTPGECKEKVEWLFFHLAYIYPFTYTVSDDAVSPLSLCIN